MMNNVKSIIQKEEYLALAINKYILQNGLIPKKYNNTTSKYELDWAKVETDEYLGVNFNRYNPILKSDIVVEFDDKNHAFIKGVVNQNSDYTTDLNYVYEFYTNRIFRISTIAPKDKTIENLLIGSEVLYLGLQEKIVSILNSGLEVLTLDKTCTSGSYFYELLNNELVYKYCKNDLTSIVVNQKEPIYLENYRDLEFVKADIGSKAYVKKNNFWYEYYFQGNTAPYWIPTGSGSTLNIVDENISIEDRILAYIPDAKDLVLRKNGGCMLANGDIFCWGDNKYKRAGVENYGQLDNSLSSDYINTPVMLKVQLDNIKQLRDNNGVLSTRNDKKWYNNPYRVKFEKMSMNSKNVCGVSPIFDYYENGVNYKFGGDIYCNGVLNSDDFEDLGVIGNTTTSILKRNIHAHVGKDDLTYDGNEKYYVDLDMSENVWAALSDSGEIYTVGLNDKGALGINSTDELAYTRIPQLINNQNQVFKKVFALRDIKGFGAIDTNNNFWYWGERPNGKIYYAPTLLASGKSFNSDVIFVNSKEFVLKGIDNIFYRTIGDLSIQSINVPSSALSVALYDYDGTEFIGYIDENMQLQGTNGLLECWNSDITLCGSTDATIFNTAFNKLNDLSNSIGTKQFANFSNVGIFESVGTVSVLPTYLTYEENFENSSTAGWNVGHIHDGGSVATKFLGRYGKNRIDTSSGAQTVYKTFNLGTDWANKNVKLSFDMYEIDSWDANLWWQDNLNGKTESFFVYVNDQQVDVDIYAYDNPNDSNYLNADSKEGVLFSSNIPGTYDVDGNTSVNYDDEKHTYSYVVTLDSNGSVKLGFGAILGEDYTNESFGIDNIKITTQIDNVTFSGDTYTETFETQSSSGWNVPRGPGPWPASEYVNYPIYEDYHLNWLSQKVHDNYFLGRFNRLDAGGGDIYHGISDGSQEVYKVFSFGADYANKEVQIEYDFYRIDNWRYDIYYTIDKFYEFINDTKTEKYPSGAPSATLDNIANSAGYNDYKYHYSKTAYLDEYGNIKLGFGAYIKDNYINQTSWGVDNIKFTLTGNSSSGGGSGTIEKNLPYICTMTGLDSASQMYCWGNVGRSMPILSTSLYDVSKISTINKLVISQEADKTKQMSYDNYNNNGNLFLKYPTYIGGFDYPFYFK